MIFEDQTRRRWRRATIAGTVLVVLSAGLFAGFVISVTANPQLPVPHLKAPEARASTQELADTTEPPGVKTPAPPVRPRHFTATAHRDQLLVKPWISSAFLVQGDPRSVADLRQNLNQLDIVFPDWYSFKNSSGELVRKVDAPTRKILNSGHAAILPRLSNTDESGAWRGDEATEMLKDWDARPRLISTLVASLVHDHAAGVNIDIEGLEPGDRERFLDWLHALAQALHKKHLYLTIDLPLNDPAFDYEAIGALADAVVIMAYDEHYPTGAMGSIAGMEWFADGVEEITRRVPAHKVLVALGGYGYDWNTSRKKPAEALGFDEIMARADRYGAEIETDRVALNSRYRYTEADGDRHEVWFLDAISAWNQLLMVQKQGIRGVSLWRLGLEEPTLWDFWTNPSLSDNDPSRLARVAGRAVLEEAGSGEILTVTRRPEEGRRKIYPDGRSIGHAVYEALPHGYAVQHYGRSAGKQVALTFDDGPDPVWTPRILDLLKRHGVTATFFVVGDQAQRFPGLVQRIVAEGHLIGNHTFDHPEFPTLSDARQKAELNLTQRIIETAIGRTTTLFRSPYDIDPAPDRRDVLDSLYTASKLGYVSIGAGIDSEDHRMPGVTRIVSNVTGGIESSGSHIILMHDAGGNRQQTVEALALLIPRLKTNGYRFVGVNDLLGLPQAAVMGELHPVELGVTLSGRVFAWLRSWGWHILEILFLVATTIAILRILFLGYFALRCRQDAAGVAAPGTFTPVAVIVPAYNEAKVIRRTLDALLASDYPNLSVIVIDDGSTDETAAIVTEIAADASQVCLISQTNSGKHAALNAGFAAASAELVVTIDADTLVLPGTISRLIEPLLDPTVDAVCGNVQVGNVKNLLTAFQDVEYVTSQNYDRRAFAELNCISVVPGATGAWRREAVLKVGGYSRDTLTEDADLTLTLLKTGGRIVYAPEARSVTEAPETPKTLFKQRFRWSFGTLQCLWKHRSQLGKGTGGWIALPNMLVFQLIFPLLSPIGDLVLLWSIMRGDFGAVAAGYFTFVFLDFVAAAIAFRLDRRPASRLVVVLLQRLYYRQFMYVVTFSAAVAALRGRLHSWNKLERHASVHLVGDNYLPTLPVRL